MIFMLYTMSMSSEIFASMAERDVFYVGSNPF